MPFRGFSGDNQLITLNKKNVKQFFLVVLAVSCFYFPSITATNLTEKERDKVRAVLSEWIDPRAEIKSIEKTPMKDLLEVRIANELVYVDRRAEFLISEGQLINLKTGENLTAKRKEQILSIDFSTLPLHLAVKTKTNFKKGAPQRVLAIFEDPYCSYCRKLRITLDSFDNLTVYSFLYPILGEKSLETSKSVWCAAEPSKALNKLMISNKEPSNTDEPCDYPSDKVIELGRSLGIQATPTIFLSNGKRIPGAISKKDLEIAFKSLD